jgi:hypothetical protein
MRRTVDGEEVRGRRRAAVLRRRVDEDMAVVVVMS